MAHFKEIECGFEYGAATVQRLASDEKRGWVCIGVKTPKEDLQIHVTKTGLVRIHGVKKEKPHESK